MSNPSVCAIMLVNGRAEMAARACASFAAQAYQDAWLLIYDTGLERLMVNPPAGSKWVVATPTPDGKTRSVGELRNRANHAAATADILIHWDSDDWSHPNRIAEQVELLRASGKQCVGYRDMLFWDSREGHFCGSWLYTATDPRYCVGTSLCYWRKTWEARPFADLPKTIGGKGEDTEWLREIDSLGVCSWQSRRVVEVGEYEPRMIASIHGGNTSTQYEDIAQSHNWRRAPEWDSYCRERMAL